MRILEIVTVGASRSHWAPAGGCTNQSSTKQSDAAPAAPAPLPAVPGAIPPAPTPPGTPGAAQSTRSLASFAKSNASATCYDRTKEPYTAVVDTHFHPKPFGGQAMPPEVLFGYLDKAGVRFVNYFGIGQSLDMTSSCTYYLDCPGTSALPSIKNDFVNGVEVKAYPHENLHIVLSMTFIDLQNPEAVVDTIRLYDKEFPGMFKWAGELNVVKQALMKNQHEGATTEDIDNWAPFMKVLQERGIPVTLHSDLGNDANPTQFVPVMTHVLQTYPRHRCWGAHGALPGARQRIRGAVSIRRHEDSSRPMSTSRGRDLQHSKDSAPIRSSYDIRPGSFRTDIVHFARSRSVGSSRSRASSTGSWRRAFRRLRWRELLSSDERSIARGGCP